MKFAIGFTIFIAFTQILALSGLVAGRWSWSMFFFLTYIYILGYYSGQSNQKEFGSEWEKRKEEKKNEW